MPFSKINAWIEKERELGSPHPDRIVLATAGRSGIAHSRVVAIRLIDEAGILFFTQRGSRKTQEIADNPYGSMTLWLAVQQREVMVEGELKPLSQEENAFYWSSRPKQTQLQFSAYAPTSGQPIASTKYLEEKRAELAEQYANKAIPVSDYYCGYRLVPTRFVFYTLNDQAFSEIIEYTRQANSWHLQPLSP